MKTNDIFHRITKAVGLDEAEILKAYELKGYEMDPKHLEALLKKRVNKGFALYSYGELGVFLDGLVTLKPALPRKNPLTMKPLRSPTISF